MEPVEIESMVNTKWRIAGTAVQGISHQKLGLPCQDAQSYRILPEDILLIALADGAGTAENSEQGAHCAVDFALGTLSEELVENLPTGNDEWEILLYRVYEDARQAIQSLADEQDALLRSFATTLTVVIAVGEQLIVAQLGDGAVIARNQEDELFAASHAQRGEYANETFFLTGDDALEHIQIQIREELVSAIAVMSDGLTRLALNLPSYEPHQPFFQPLFAFASAAKDEDLASAQLAEFLASDRVCARTDDDKSLVLAVRIDNSREAEAESIQETIKAGTKPRRRRAKNKK